MEELQAGREVVAEKPSMRPRLVLVPAWHGRFAERPTSSDSAKVLAYPRCVDIPENLSVVSLGEERKIEAAGCWGWGCFPVQLYFCRQTQMRGMICPSCNGVDLWMWCRVIASSLHHSGWHAGFFSCHSKLQSSQGIRFTTGRKSWLFRVDENTSWQMPSSACQRYLLDMQPLHNSRTVRDFGNVDGQNLLLILHCVTRRVWLMQQFIHLFIPPTEAADTLDTGNGLSRPWCRGRMSQDHETYHNPNTCGRCSQIFFLKAWNI